jgi:hypothetical protein
MPIYYFHIRSGDELKTDEVGLDLADDAAAKEEARRSAGEMLRDATLRPSDILEVMDGRGVAIPRFCCSDVEDVDPGSNGRLAQKEPIRWRSA